MNRAVLTIACVAQLAIGGTLHAATTARQSALAGLDHLRRSMDQFHDRFPVYDDISSAGNHFHARAKLPDANAPVSTNGSWTVNPHSGATAIRFDFSPTMQSSPFGGYYFQNGTLSNQETRPQLNFGTVPNAGIDLTGATSLTFWARGATGGEQIDFFVAGVGRDAQSGQPLPNTPYPDSSPRRPALPHLFTLTTAWQQFTIDLTGANLSYVLGGFGWAADVTHNPNGAVFFVDDIQFELGASRREQRLNEPRFIASFTTLPVQPDPFDANRDDDIDFVLRNAAFAYDNAVALLAFLADGTSDSLRRARLIGDAFVYASQHDRTYNDNRSCSDTIDPLGFDGARVRTAYAAGDIALPPGWNPNGRTGTVPIPGFYVESADTFYEVEQEGIDTGNNAWAAVALLALHQRTGVTAYRDTACKIANFIHAFRKDTGTYQGFTGGVDNPEAVGRSLRPWASSEHNLDINAAFTTLFALLGDARWQQDADHARTFVEAMWDGVGGCYLAGTTSPSARNTGPNMLPLDVQAWSVLSLPGVLSAHPNVLQCAEVNHLNTHDGFTGFDFNNDKDGVWFEGTGQMAVAYTLEGEPAKTETYRQELRRAQETAPTGNGRGISGASHDGLSTGFLTAGGFPFKYFLRLHTGATAWNVFAQTAVDPYYDFKARLRRNRRDFDGDAKSDVIWLNPSTGEARMWLLSGNTIVSDASLGNLATAYFVAGVGDFDGNGKSDIIWRSTTNGDTYIWLMNGAVIAGGGFLASVPSPWIIAGTGDFDGDGRSDVIWRNTSTGDTWIWLLNGNSIAGGGFLANLSSAWSVAGVGDFNDDGKSDLVWRNAGTGDTWIWLLNGNSIAGGGFLSNLSSAWSVAGVGDFDDDGKSDVVWRNSSSGEAWIWLINGNSIAGGGLLANLAASWTIAAVADFDGDGKSDVIWRNTSTGETSVWLLNGNTISGGGLLANLPPAWTLAPSP